MNTPHSPVDPPKLSQSFRTRTRTSMHTRARALQVVPPDVVRAAIARALRGQTTSASLGSLTLLPHQQDAVSRLRIILKEMRVALLADDVGHGKTYVALAVAREYNRVQIIAPAALLSMWRNAVARTQTANAELQSVQSYSRKTVSAAAPNTAASTSPPPASPPARTLYIIDEAHHLRTQNTRRFRAVANAVSGHDVLLLSATPIHNSPDDLRSLLALALGTRANRLTSALLSRVIVRRSQNVGSPSVTEHPPTPVPHDPAILNAILSLPAPLPAHDGAVAGALIRMGLLRAWCSSDAALAHALRQRVLRGEALRQALLSNRHPTASEMRSWLVGDHEVQLAFPELMAQHAPASGTLLEVLDTHVRAVEQIIGDHRMGASGDGARARILKDLLAQHPGTPIIAFSQFAETVRAIGRALTDIAGVGVLTGKRAWIASGVISRAEALDHFAPIAQGKPPPREHQRIRLLLTTDLLAEGVNLQDAGVVVHLDLPWTDALRSQRVGRCVRMGSPHHTVHVYTVAPHAKAERALRLQARLHRKAQSATRVVGIQHSSHSKASPSAADMATAAHRIVASWQTQDETAGVHSEGAYVKPAPVSGKTYVTTVAAPVHGFIAVVSAPSVRIVCGRAANQLLGRAPRWTVGTSMRLFHALVAHANPLASAVAQGTWQSTIPSNNAERFAPILRHICLWARRHAARSAIGLHAFPAEGAHDPPSSAIYTKAHSAVAQGIAKLSLASRASNRICIRDTTSMINAVRGAGAERALASWIAQRSTMPFQEWLMHWKSCAVLVRGEQTHHTVSLESHFSGVVQIHYVMALLPP